MATRAARWRGKLASSSGSSATETRLISARVSAFINLGDSKAARRTLPCVSAVATTYFIEKRASAGVRGSS